MENKRYAVLIDADNTGSKYIGVILDEVSKKGVATIKRIYGDWTNPAISPWKETNLEYSITPIQQYSYTVGKNSTDSAMIIDAMDILYSEKVDGFCLVSSDSDFTRLAIRLREAGMDVIGMGREQTPQPFVKACADFKFIDVLFEDPTSDKSDKTETDKSDSQAEKGTTSKTSLEEIRKTTISIIYTESNDDGWIPASDVGNGLKKRYSDFDPRNYGFKKLVDMLEHFKDCIDVDKRKDTNNSLENALIVYVRIKERRAKKKSSAKSAE